MLRDELLGLAVLLLRPWWRLALSLGTSVVADVTLGCHLEEQVQQPLQVEAIGRQSNVQESVPQALRRTGAV